MVGRRLALPVAAGTCLCAALAGAAATSTSMAAAVCVALVLFLAFVLDRGGVLVGIASLLLFMASAVSVEQMDKYQDAVRIAAIVVLAFGAACGAVSTTGSGWDRGRSARPLFAAYLVGMTGYLVAATLPFGDTESLAVGSAGLVLLTAYLLLATKLLSPQTLDVAVVSALVAAVAFSLLLGFVLPDIAMLGGRLQGITANPNLLGMYAFLLVAAVVLRSRPWPLTLAAIGLGVAALVWTASRGSALALLATVIVGAGMKAGRARQLALPLLALGIIPVALTVYGAEPTEIKLFRSNNSREGSIQEVVDLVRTGSLGGVGIGNERTLLASSPLGAFVHGGVVALCSILLIYVAFLWLSWKAGRATFAFAVGAVVHSNFEAWLLSSMGPMLVLIALTWMSMPSADPGGRGGQGAPSERVPVLVPHMPGRGA